MRPALTTGAAFVCGEMGHGRDLCSSHTLCRDQRAIRIHLMISKQARAHAHMPRCMHAYNEAPSIAGAVRG